MNVKVVVEVEDGFLEGGAPLAPDLEKVKEGEVGVVGGVGNETVGAALKEGGVAGNGGDERRALRADFFFLLLIVRALMREQWWGHSGGSRGGLRTNYWSLRWVGAIRVGRQGLLPEGMVQY